MHSNPRPRKSGKLVILGILLLIVLLLASRNFLISHDSLLQQQVPAHFPAAPADSATITVQGASLGKMLFHDPLLSAHQQVSCSSCHQQAHAYADAGKRVSLGDDAQPTLRNSPALVNLIWKTHYFADGRADQLAQTIHNAVIDSRELNSNWPLIVSRVAAHPVYAEKFKRINEGQPVTATAIVSVLTQYLRTLNSWHSKYDEVQQGRAHYSAEEQRGYTLFQQNCQSCHVPPLFHAIAALDEHVRKAAALESPFVPGLRNISYTAPYLYDGSAATLQGLLSTHALPHGSTPTPQPRAQHEIAALVAFLHTLSDPAYTSSSSY